MLKRFVVTILLMGFMAIVWQGCSEKEKISTALISEYYPLQIGKYITYRLDSTVYVNLNTKKEVHTYIVQDWVDAEITDNLGRKAYRIRRVMQQKTDTTQWVDNAVFVVTSLGKSLEYVDNNLRFIKLQEPIRDDFTWRGNSYINSFSDQDLQYLDNWEYFYENTNQPFTLGSKSFPETLLVNQRDEVINNPDDKTTIFSVNQSSEVFAKGIGLIYKNFLHETWQPPNSTSPGGFYEPSSYGIKLTYINNN